ARQHNHLLSLFGIGQRNGPVGVWILVGADCSGEQMRERLAFGFRLREIGKRTLCRIESSPHQRHTDIGVGEAACLSHSLFDSPECDENRIAQITAHEAQPGFVRDGRMEKRLGECSGVAKAAEVWYSFTQTGSERYFMCTG